MPPVTHNKLPRSGDTVTLDGGEFFAVFSPNGGCEGCVFRGGKTIGEHSCDNTACGNCVWLTKLDYIKHRLTS